MLRRCWRTVLWVAAGVALRRCSRCWRLAAIQAPWLAVLPRRKGSVACGHRGWKGRSGNDARGSVVEGSPEPGQAPTVTLRSVDPNHLYSEDHADVALLEVLACCPGVFVCDRATVGDFPLSLTQLAKAAVQGRPSHQSRIGLVG